METVFFTPEQIFSQLEIGKNIVAADFGCGSGFFSIPLAKIVKEGTVFSLDVMKDALAAVEAKARMENISNIKTIHCNLEVIGSSKIENDSVDLVLLRNILFQSQKKENIVQEAKRILKKQASLVVVEWIPGSSLAPKKGWLIAKEDARTLAEKEGMSFDRELTTDDQHYGLVFKK